MSDGLSAYQLSLIRDALGQAGLDQGAMFAGGLRVGSIVPQLGPGDAELTGSVRRSRAISAGVQRSTDQNIPNITWTPLSFDTTVWDNDGIFDVTSPTVLTIRTGGIYIFSGYVLLNANATGQRLCKITCNGGPVIAFQGVQATTALYVAHSVAGLWSVNQGDYVEFSLYQSSGAGLGLQVSLPTLGPTFCASRVV